MGSTTPTNTNEKKHLESKFEKSISKFSCLMIGIGGLIGGGIFSVIGAISVYTGPYSYVSYFITGIVTLFTVYSYSKLNKLWASPGGEYIIVRNAFEGKRYKSLGPIVGILLYFGYIVTMALYAYTFSVYFLYLFGIPVDNFFIILIIIILISLFTVLNLFHVKDSALLEDILVVIKIIILVFFVIFGLIYSFSNINKTITNVGLGVDSLQSFNLFGIILGSTLIIISYQGFQLIAYEAYEMKDKSGGLRMMKWSIIITMILYITVGITAVSVLGVSGLIGKDPHHSELAIAIAANVFLSPLGTIIIIIGALFSTASALNATIIGTSRLAFMMGSEKLLPKSLSKLNSQHEPYISVISVGVLSIIVALVTGGALAIAGVAGLIFSQVTFIINFTNFHARKKTNSKAVYPVVGMILTATFFVILLVYSFYNIFSEFFSLVVFFTIEGVIIVFVISKLDFHLTHINSLVKNQTLGE